MTGGSLFSGIGGIDLGFERVGIETRWQFEIDAVCSRVLAARFPNIPNYGNVRKLHDVESIDVLHGGFPCQPISHAGVGRGLKDYRWLWPFFVQYIEKLQPQWVVIENVPGLRSVIGAFGNILDDLARCGYDAEWDSISASSVGAPHQRERVWFVAYPKGFNTTSSPIIFRQPSEFGDAFYESCNPRSKWVIRVGDERLDTEETALPSGYGWWGHEPRLARMVYGISGAMDRYKVIGNAVVPHVAEWIGRRIVTAS